MDIIELAKRRGFFWQSSQVHGSLSGFYDYGHIGTLLKRKWEDLWRKFFLGLDENFWEISTSLVMPENVFKASGHLAHFVDPLVECGKCGHQERADTILEERLKESFEGLQSKELLEIMHRHKIKCPECGGEFKAEKTLNIMFPLVAGAGKETRKAYLTPETAQGAYVNFPLEFEALRKRLPLGLAIIGKAFRNEISPRNALLRMREFTQAELQVFFDPEQEGPKAKGNCRLKIKPAEKKAEQEIPCSELELPEAYKFYLSKMQEFFLDFIGIPKEKFRLRELSKEERAFYNRFHYDAEIFLNGLGWKEVGGCHHRGDHDLSGHQKVSGQRMSVNIDGKEFIPNVIELSFGVDRNLFALLDIFLEKEKERLVLRLPARLSPLDAAIFPLVNKGGLPEKAIEVKELLKKAGFQTYSDHSGSIGRMYRRIDEIGGMACITIDYDSLKHEDVTVRDRDTMRQVRIKIKDLPEALKSLLEGEKIEGLGKPIK